MLSKQRELGLDELARRIRGKFAATAHRCAQLDLTQRFPRAFPALEFEGKLGFRRMTVSVV